MADRIRGVFSDKGSAEINGVRVPIKRMDVEGLTFDADNLTCTVVFALELPVTHEVVQRINDDDHVHLEVPAVTVVMQ